MAGVAAGCRAKAIVPVPHTYTARTAMRVAFPRSIASAIPLRSYTFVLDGTDDEECAKANGAVGVFFRGIEGNYTLDNPYFFPVYQAAMDVDLPICIHTGSGDAVGDSDVRPGKKPAVVPFGFPAIARFPRSCLESNSRNVSAAAVWLY